jgi:hypothetical protein
MVYTLSFYRSQNLESNAARISFATLGYKLLVMCAKTVTAKITIKLVALVLI